MPERAIEQIIDSCLQKWIDRGLNRRPGEIEPGMAGEKDKEGWTTWFPIDSKVTDSEIVELVDSVTPMSSNFSELMGRLDREETECTFE